MHDRVEGFLRSWLGEVNLDGAGNALPRVKGNRLPRNSRMQHPGQAVTAGLVAIMLSFLAFASLAAQEITSIPEAIEWTWEVRPPHPDAKLPNVLLLGDSITRNYFPEVTSDLTGVANVYLMASSTSRRKEYGGKQRSVGVGNHNAGRARRDKWSKQPTCRCAKRDCNFPGPSGGHSGR
jgi:hypothetical protein